MRPHGRARISAKNPEALGICYRCGALYNLVDLQWQFDWEMSSRLHNTGILVCDDCYDTPQESGRPIILPPDPISVDYASPEPYARDDNPVSPLGYDVANQFTPPPLQSLGANIGNLTLNAGVNAAFDGNTNKRAPFCAGLSISISSFQNAIGKNWNAYPSGIALTLPTTAPAITHVLSSFAIYAPSDQPFLNSAGGVTGFHVDGSLNNATWVTLYAGTTAGTVGEIITGVSTFGAAYPYHRVAFQGDGLSAISVAQVQFNVADAFPNDI